MISFFCPFCKHVIKTVEETAGTLIACEQCKLDIRVPQPAAPVLVSPVPQRLPSEPMPPWWKRFLHRGNRHAGA